MSETDNPLAGIRADIAAVKEDIAFIRGTLAGKLHEPATCGLRDDVAELQLAVSSSKSFLAGILFLAGFLGSGVTLGVSVLIQWLRG